MVDLKSLPVIDFNIHLPMGNDGLYKRHEEDLQMKICDLSKAIDFYTEDLKTIKSANYMLFNQYVTEEKGFKVDFEALLKSARIHDGSTFTLLLDFRHPNVRQHIKDARELGVLGVKFHSYIQKIQEEDFAGIVELCEYAQELGMFICIDTSYGSINLYKYDNLRLAVEVADRIKNAPIVLLHSGGARVLEAMLIADMQENIFLETSLTIPFYDGSALWKDIAYTYRKLNCDRVLYATDFPYITLERSFETHTRFFAEFGFEEGEINKIMYLNANKLLASLRQKNP
ncbi:MAG TPA: hypothetical protein DCR48_03910 [Flavobacteriales bacterium]|nr:hypothetical protein [Flavobacteriales bacterium]